jgi:sigma-B regulation protein RsbU (phosphoserine phosphatase)
MAPTLKRLILLLFFILINIVITAYIIGLIAIGDTINSAEPLAEYFKSLTTFAFFAFLIGAISLKWSTRGWIKLLMQVHHLLESLVLHHFKLTPLQKEMIQTIANDPRPEVAQMGSHFYSMVGHIEQSLSRENHIANSKENFDSQLNIGREIQLSLLPDLNLLLEKRQGFDIAAALRQSKEVGGDGYDCFLLDPHHLLCSIGDVSGKGVPAAIFMTVAKTLVKSYAESNVSPGKILNHVNKELCRNNDSSMFVSFFIGILHLDSGLFEYSCAGHSPPYLLSNKGGISPVKIPSHPAIGVVEDYKYNTLQIQLTPYDKLFFYTNIANEIHNSQDQLYTYEDLERTLALLRHRRAREVIAGVLGEIDEFTKKIEQSDDLTLLCLEYQGPPLSDQESQSNPA